MQVGSTPRFAGKFTFKTDLNQPENSDVMHQVVQAVSSAHDEILAHEREEARKGTQKEAIIVDAFMRPNIVRTYRYHVGPDGDYSEDRYFGPTAEDEALKRNLTQIGLVEGHDYDYDAEESLTSKSDSPSGDTSSPLSATRIAFLSSRLSRK